MVREESAATSSSTNDVEKQELRNLDIDDTNEPLESAKEKPPPGINASVVMLYAMFIAMFTIGWVNLNNCSVNRLIPIYLIVAGFLGGIAKFLTKVDNRFAFNLAMVLVIFDIFWHGVGEKLTRLPRSQKMRGYPLSNSFLIVTLGDSSLWI
ncbi:unnamed protein product [Callosobruchus maculatus]|uniref:Uncharacterized protein n=1 Tax=Callosobruchus maculatus TaxID=64391 RepID=A0A653CF00_CALMS|nr:unnamed protein product [Callosobruchus maculatus]